MRRGGAMTGSGAESARVAGGHGSVAGLLLAAGGGRRLGGRPKALLPHRGRPLAEHAMRVLREGGCDPLYVVLGAAADEVRARAELPDCVLLENPDWADGMGSSLRTGLAALAATDAGAVVIGLVDQPGIGADVVSRVREAAAGAGGPGGVTLANELVAAAYDGRRGHPVLFGRAHWSGVAGSARGDQGARDYLSAHERELVLVECGDLADPADIDIPADLPRLDP